MRWVGKKCQTRERSATRHDHQRPSWWCRLPAIVMVPLFIARIKVDECAGILLPPSTRALPPTPQLANGLRTTFLIETASSFCCQLQQKKPKQQCNSIFRSTFHRRYLSAISLASSNYGKGAEIWPPGNEQRVNLQDSFPESFLPKEVAAHRFSLVSRDPAQGAEGEFGDESEEVLPRRWRIRKSIWHILKRAARFERAESVKESWTEVITKSTAIATHSGRGRVRMKRSPAILATLLLVFGLVRSTDILFVIAFSGYLVFMLRWTRRYDGQRFLQGVPPQGHVPSMISNPLGRMLTESAMYRYWLRAGASVGLLGPVIFVGYCCFKKRYDVASLPASPLFLLCCQAVTESAFRRSMAPLPLRILIPVAYNWQRLGPLWTWALSRKPLGRIGRLLAVANVSYWTVNLFGFLIPKACPLYLRAYFYCIEASDVTLRDGYEDGVGLLSKH